MLTARKFITVGMFLVAGFCFTRYAEAGEIKITPVDEEIVIKSGESKSFTFLPITVDKSKPKSAVLSMEALIKHKSVAGYGAAMKIEMNWAAIEGPRLINKPLNPRYGAKGKTVSLYDSPSKQWRPVYAPDFLSPDRSIGYRLEDGSTCRFEFDITDLVTDKKMNEVTIRNIKRNYAIVIRNLIIKHDGKIKSLKEDKPLEDKKKDTGSLSEFEKMSQPYELDENTLLLMHFDERRGRIAKDSVNKSLKGTMFNVTYESILWTKGRFGNALAFEPDGDYMIIPDREKHIFNFDEKQDFAIDFWLFINEINPSWECIVFKGATSEKDPGYGIYVYNGKVLVQVSDGAGKKNSRMYVRSNTDIRGDWHHVAFIADRSGVLGIPNRAYIFIDGIKQEKPEDISNLGGFETEGDLLLGSYTKDSRYGFDGKIDEFRISKKVRTLGELNYGGYFPQR